MKCWQILVMFGIVLGSPFLLNGNLPPYASLPIARAANEPGASADSPSITNNSVAGIAAELKQVLQMGILGWFCWFVTARAGPKMLQDFRDEMKAEREANRITLDKIAGDYRTQYGEAVKLFADRDRQIHDDLVQLGTTMNNTVRHCAETTAKHAVGIAP